MPLYEYQCQACGRRLERIQKFSDPPLEVCPHCGGKLEKLISSPAIQFKGSGWYITDYARKGESSKDKGSSSSKDSADKSSSADKTEKTEKKDTGDSASKPSADAAPTAKESAPAAKKD
jgi:putative FmdB family regulatory protein